MNNKSESPLTKKLRYTLNDARTAGAKSYWLKNQPA
jgi:hypothetical protein